MICLGGTICLVLALYLLPNSIKDLPRDHPHFVYGYTSLFNR